MDPRLEHAQSESELYQTVVQARQEKLRSQLHKVAGQKAFLRHEHRRLMLQRALLESEHQRFEASLTSDWFCHEDRSSTTDRLRIQVGDQEFEISMAIARKDPKSLLAALVATDSPLGAAEVGCFCINRDWNLFRVMLNFLRDGVLPNDPKLLRALYVESEFWKFESLKLAIEQGKIQLKTTTATSNVGVEGASHANAARPAESTAKGIGSNSTSSNNASATRPWWNEPPQWWGKATLPKTSDGPKKDEKPDPYAWWKGSKYKGNDYAKFLTDQLAIETGPPTANPPSGSGGGGASSTSQPSQQSSSGDSSYLAQSLFKAPYQAPASSNSAQPSAPKKDEYPLLRSTWTSFRHLA
ncbi:hypothetical protein H310_04346 [Aphanomyces invadans]|uniref:Potassium channel tetramerisation-type BTB domain-containing protein n=1 Tax=Aphanomyces invadans TaxID=157072 RepID=A0A024UEA5_9STRA|nr:hypothetical protein H310_04346 [Aphanomyces invadans]ETW03928.1 hypothetical protein H310_04346 [Aphanomyces invadans]|eukprot:XP_008866884.1 hypothetical protein H310_04346 [Aphanomyces invadans]